MAEQAHVLELNAEDWTLDHPDRCGVDREILSCPVSMRLTAWLGLWDDAPVPLGRYYIREDGMTLWAVSS
jgi:hypothetical protein